EPAHVHAQPAKPAVSGRRQRQAPARVRAVHPQRPGHPAAEAQAVQHDARLVARRAMSLTADEVRWVAHLARLQLTDAELATMTRQLSAILEYVDLLKQVNTDGVEPLA